MKCLILETESTSVQMLEQQATIELISLLFVVVVEKSNDFIELAFVNKLSLDVL